jgi:predicted transposase/invertase (TIGR01784 family)
METNNSFESSQRFNPLNDYLFYKVMGEKGDEEQLLGFLNAVLGHSGKEPIKSVEILENKALTADIVNGKSCILDVRAALADGSMVNIEVQLRNEHNIDRRSLFHWSRMYSESLNKGEDYQKLPNVIAVNIVDFDFPAEGDVHTCFHLREDTNPSLILTDALEIHFVNMVKWRKRADNDIANDPLHRWLVWFDAKSPRELVEEVKCMDSAIMAANEKQEYITQDWEERDLYRRRQMAIMDYNSGINYARQEGLREGEQKGEENKATEIARKALAEKLPVDVIQKITGLDMETIHVIAKT